MKQQKLILFGGVNKVKLLLISILFISCLPKGYCDSLQVIDRAIIYKEKFYIPKYVEGNELFIRWQAPIQSLFIRTTSIKEERPTIFTGSLQYTEKAYPFPVSWTINSDSSFMVLESYPEINWSAAFYQYPIELRDTATVKYEGYQRWKELAKIQGEEFVIDDEYNDWLNNLKNIREVEPINNYINFYRFPRMKYREDREYLMSRNLDYTFVQLDSKLYRLYFRDEYCLYVWDYSYPSKGNRSYLEDWKEKVCYCKDKLPHEIYNSDILRQQYPDIQGILKKDLTHLPTFNDAHFNSINDSLFFSGHFKAYWSNENTWFINQKHGGIYYLGEKNIEKIGILQIDNIHFLIDGIKLFIEDRDNNQLIFFAPVEWMRDDLPKPNVRIITDEKEFKEMFKYVLE